ncbi:hypothetical protein ACROYT_G030241 [Oculina patagonica]
MDLHIRFGILFLLFSVKAILSCLGDECRELEFPNAYFFNGKRLINHVIRSIKVLDQDSCEFQCYLEHNCVSINFEFTGTKICDLNNSTHKEHDKDLVKREGFVYHGTDNACSKTSCKNNATCQAGFTSKRYRCVCASGFTGQDCEHDIDECAQNTHNCSKNGSLCNNTEGSFVCSCKPGFTGDGHSCLGFGINSTILLKNESFLPHLHRFLSTAVGNDSQWLLCYRASLHGWDASTFHSRCDGKKNTVTIIEKDSYVFGGYTDIPWADCPPGARTIDPQGRCCVFPFEYRKKTYHTCTTAGFAYYKLWCSFDAVYNNNWADCDSTPYLEYRSSTKAFIYSLSNKEGLEPFQAMVKDAPHAIYTDPSLGPTFGVGKDIYIASNANANYGSYTNFGWSYDVPDGVKDQQTILAGTYHFLLDEVEVFYLI